MSKQKRRDLGVRRSDILNAAIDVFLRFGYAKTTLGDIAQIAKVHRPVLYNLFPGGKEELFEVALMHWVREIISAYRSKVGSLTTVRERLLYCTEHWCVEGFKLTSRHPDARDAFDIRYPAVRKMYELLTSFYADLLRETVETSCLNLNAEQLAALLVFSLRGVRQIPYDPHGMKHVVHQEIEVFLAALNYRPAAVGA